MRTVSHLAKVLYLVVSGIVATAASASCVPDNLWANIWGTTIIDGTVTAVRNTLLTALNLQTP